MKIDREFEAYLSAEPSRPEPTLSAAALEPIRRELALRPAHLLAKLFLIHLVVGSLSLVFCPQFGIGPFGGGDGLTHWVMRWGGSVCALLCGAIFLGSSGLVASLLLHSWELRALRRHLLGYYSAMAGISAGLLLLLGSLFQSSAHHPLSAPFLATWLAAAILAAATMTALVSWTRRV